MRFIAQQHPPHLARLKGRQRNLTLIQCYSPINDSEDRLKDNFYLRLHEEIEQVPMQDLIIIMGDLNAKVGADNSGIYRVMERHGSGVINENGERLVEFCTPKNLVIGGTSFFPHREIHNITCMMFSKWQGQKSNWSPDDQREMAEVPSGC